MIEVEEISLGLREHFVGEHTFNHRKNYWVGFSLRHNQSMLTGRPCDSHFTSRVPTANSRRRLAKHSPISSANSENPRSLLGPPDSFLVGVPATREARSRDCYSPHRGADSAHPPYPSRQSWGWENPYEDLSISYCTRRLEGAVGGVPA